MRKIILILLIIFFYIGLPLLILADIIDFEFKFHILTIGGILILILMLILGFKPKDMGITYKKSCKSIKNILPVTSVLLAATLALYIFANVERFNPSESTLFYVFYIFISCPIQEFIYRGALGIILKEFALNEYIITFLTALLYSFVHIIYKDLTTLILTFFIGIIWYRAYKKTNNLLGVCLSHCVLGIVTIATGLID